MSFELMIDGGQEKGENRERESRWQYSEWQKREQPISARVKSNWDTMNGIGDGQTRIAAHWSRWKLIGVWKFLIKMNKINAVEAENCITIYLFNMRSLGWCGFQLEFFFHSYNVQVSKIQMSRKWGSNKPRKFDCIIRCCLYFMDFFLENFMLNAEKTLCSAKLFEYLII